MIKEIDIDGTMLGIKAKAKNVKYEGNMSGVDNAEDAIDALAHAIEVGGGETSKDGYGPIGTKRPEQVTFIENVLDKFVNNGGTNHFECLNFIHISDSHGATIGGSSELLDAVGAEFLIHTGDMLSDKWRHDFEALKAKLIAPAKRSYVIIGNHDRVGESTDEFTMADVHTRYIKPLIDRYGSGSADEDLHVYADSYMVNQNDITTYKRTYYSFLKTIPCGEQKVIRCIVLNEYETAGKTVYNPQLSMSDTQIRWFIGELQAAAAAGQHVAIFAHQIISPISNLDFKWHDGPYTDNYGNYPFGEDGTRLASIVDAFMRGTSIENVSICGNNYSYTHPDGASAGIFVGWFCGHTHSDEQGWITAYPRQHVSVTTRAEGKSAGDYDHTILADTGFKDKWNYVKINPSYRMVTIYRVGNQQTYHGFKRDILNYRY